MSIRRTNLELPPGPAPLAADEQPKLEQSRAHLRELRSVPGAKLEALFAGRDLFSYPPPEAITLIAIARSPNSVRTNSTSWSRTTPSSLPRISNRAVIPWHAAARVICLRIVLVGSLELGSQAGKAWSRQVRAGMAGATEGHSGVGSLVPYANFTLLLAGDQWRIKLADTLHGDGDCCPECWFWPALH